MVSSVAILQGSHREKVFLLYGARRCEQYIYRLIRRGLTGHCKFIVRVAGGKAEAVDGETRELFAVRQATTCDRTIEAQKAKFRVGGFRYQTKLFRALDNQGSGRYVLFVQIEDGIIRACNGEGSESYL